MRLALTMTAMAISAIAQNAGTDHLALAGRMSQLMESTAVAVPDLIPASEPVRRLANITLTSLKTAPGNPALDLRFIAQVKAYLALSESFPVAQIPPVAEQQFGELRQDVVRLQQLFEAALESQNRGQAAEEADPNGLKRYSEANGKLAPESALPRVVFLGDSLTERWPLQEAFAGRDFINRGIGGQNTTQMLGRFMQDVILVHPRAVVVLAGTNDIAHGIPSYAIEDELSMMGDLAKAHGIRPLFASVLPVSAAEAKTRPLAAIQQVNRWLKDYCQREGFTYLDYFTALADANGELPADLTDDGIHPNANGYRVMAPVALDAINRTLSAVSPAPADRQTTTKRRFGLPGISK